MAGGRPPDVTDDEIVDAIKSAPDPVLSIAELAERVDLGRRGLRYRLQELAEDDRVVSKKIGNSRVYYAPELVRLQEQLQGDAEPAPATAPGGRDPAPDPDPDPEPRPEAPGPNDDARVAARELALDVVEDLDLPGQDPVLQERRDAVVAAVELIASSGTATRTEILDALYPAHAAAYKSPISLWKNALQPALSQLADRVDRLATDGQRWRWTS